MIRMTVSNCYHEDLPYRYTVLDFPADDETIQLAAEMLGSSSVYVEWDATSPYNDWFGTLPHSIDLAQLNRIVTHLENTPGNPYALVKGTGKGATPLPPWKQGRKNWN